MYTINFLNNLNYHNEQSQIMKIFFYQFKIHANNMCVIKNIFVIVNVLHLDYFLNEEKSRFCFPSTPNMIVVFVMVFST